MSGIKKLSTRIINKHATAAIWNTKTNFYPLQGETIVYDPGYDSTDGKIYKYERFKIGDGTHNVTELPFANEQQAVVTKTTKSATVVTNVELPVYSAAQYTAPSMGQQLTDDILTVTFDSGSYVPATMTAGSTSSSSVNYLEDVNVTVEDPHYQKEQ